MQYSESSSVRRLRHFDLSVFIWFKVSSRGRLIQKKNAVKRRAMGGIAAFTKFR
jgi:hypothetical protein